MGMTRDFYKGLLLGLLVLGGCAAVPFSYKYYGLDAKSYDGTLLGPAVGDDLPFTICAPTPESRSPCVVFQADEFYAMKQDYLQTKQDLINCQKPK